MIINIDEIKKDYFQYISTFEKDEGFTYKNFLELKIVNLQNQLDNLKKQIDICVDCSDADDLK